MKGHLISQAKEHSASETKLWLHLSMNDQLIQIKVDQFCQKICLIFFEVIFHFFTDYSFCLTTPEKRK